MPITANSAPTAEVPRNATADGEVDGEGDGEPEGGGEPEGDDPVGVGDEVADGEVAGDEDEDTEGVAAGAPLDAAASADAPPAG